MTDELRGVPPEGGPPDDVLEKIVGEALYFDYPHPVVGDVQRKVVLEAVAKIRAALRASGAGTRQEEPVRVGGGFWRCEKCGEEYHASIAHECAGGQPPSDGMPGEVPWEEILGHMVDNIVQRVAELPDRTSPDNWPEAMLVTGSELRRIVADELAYAAERGVSAVPPTEGHP